MALDISQLDFDIIKSNLKDFLRTQDEFQDFDFDGSAINILLDVLSATTQYLGVYSNFSLNEMFLESASLRNNVVKKAKELNYFPRQGAAPTMNITLSIVPSDSPISILIPKNTKFTGTIDDTVYTFVNTEDVTLVDNAGTYSATFNVRQGILIQEQFSYSENEKQLVLSNSKIDDSVFTVSVDGTTWDRGNSIINVDSASKYYYIYEDNDEFLGIYFGDGVISTEPNNNQVVDIEYLISKGEEANGLTKINLSENISSYNLTEFTLTVNSSATGGTYAESSETIRFNAPNYYSAQSRAVTVDDYSSLLINKFSNIKSISVWGGEDNIPVRYGAVYVCIRPQTAEVLTPTEKDQIDAILSAQGLLTVTPFIVDPEYLYLNLSIDVTYNKQKTTHSQGNIQSLVVDEVNDYFDDSLSNFNDVLRNSKLLTVVDDSENSILGSKITISMSKVENVNLGSQYIDIEFNNKIESGTILSSSWNVSADTYYIKDVDGEMYSYKNDVVIEKIGTVNYDTGFISFSNIDAYANNTNITFNATPSEKDISIVKNSLLNLSLLTVNVNGIIE